MTEERPPQADAEAVTVVASLDERIAPLPPRRRATDAESDPKTGIWLLPDAATRVHSSEPSAEEPVVPVGVPEAASPISPALVTRVWKRARAELAETRPALRLAGLALPLVAWIALEPDAPVARGASATAPEPPRALSPEKRSESLASSQPLVADAPARSADASVTIEQVQPRPAESARPKGRGEQSLEARAADAAARGATSEAIALYEELCARHPERSEYAAAARILRASR